MDRAAPHAMFSLSIPSATGIWPSSRERVADLFKERSLDVQFGVGDGLFAFHVVLNNNEEYEILDEADQKIINVPAMPQEHWDVSQVCRVVEHFSDI